MALTPVSPISWGYSTWLLFLIPLSITVFAPIRTFSGPSRYAYLEYGSKITSWLVSLLKAVTTNFHSVPTLALPALFFLPVLPVLFFIFFPALPMAWHFIAYHYRRRLKVVTTSTATTIANLELAIARAGQANALAHTYEKQALYTVSTTRSAALLALPRHSTDFDTSASDKSEEPGLGALGADLAGKVLYTEKQMAVIENESQEVRALAETAVATAVEGNMEEGEKLAQDATRSLKNVVKQVDELCSGADQARRTWIEYRRCLNVVIKSASTTMANLDLNVTRARRAITLAHTYEEQALSFVSTTRRTTSMTLTLHSVDFFDTSVSAWAAIGHTTAQTEDLVAAARDVVPVADTLRQSQLPNQDTRLAKLAEIVYKRANDVVGAASEAERMAHQAQESVGRSENAKRRAEQTRQLILKEAKKVQALGLNLTQKMLEAEAKIAEVENEAEKVRALLEEAVAVAVDGDVATGETLTTNAAGSLRSVVERVHGLCSVADEVRKTCVELLVKT